MKFRPFLFIIPVLFLFGCRSYYAHNEMFKLEGKVNYTDFTHHGAEEYRIAIGDYIELYVTNALSYSDKNEVVPRISGAVGGAGGRTVGYAVKPDSMVELPIIGEINLVGKTIPECQEILKIKYLIDAGFKDAMVQLYVSNKRVFVFNGVTSASVIYLLNENTTLIEVLASAGGIAESSSASKIKLIRGQGDNAEVGLIDLSTIQGIQQAQMVVQANDIIYIEPVVKPGKKLFQDITPYLGIATTALTLFLTIQNLSGN